MKLFAQNNDITDYLGDDSEQDKATLFVNNDPGSIIQRYNVMIIVKHTVCMLHYNLI